MENREMLLKSNYLTKLHLLWEAHSLPFDIVEGGSIAHLRQIVINYEKHDELLVDWALDRAESDDE